MKNQLRLVVDGGNVRRYHTVPTHTQETVGHHSFTVAWLVTLLHADIPRPQLLLAALQHDLAEVETGDIPAPFKRTIEGLRDQFNAHEAKIVTDHSMRNYEAELTTREKHLLKMADSMAGMVLCIHERLLGNAHVTLAFSRFANYVTTLIGDTEDGQVLYDTLLSQWKEACNVR